LNAQRPWCLARKKGKGAIVGGRGVGRNGNQNLKKGKTKRSQCPSSPRKVVRADRKEDSFYTSLKKERRKNRRSTKKRSLVLAQGEKKRAPPDLLNARKISRKKEEMERDDFARFSEARVLPKENMPVGIWRKGRGRGPRKENKSQPTTRRWAALCPEKEEAQSLQWGEKKN